MDKENFDTLIKFMDNTNHAITIPINGAIKNMSAFFYFTSPARNARLNIIIRMYYSMDGVSFERLPGAELIMHKPADIYPTFLRGLRNDYNITVYEVSRLLMVFSATSENGNITVNGYASVSLGIQ